MKRFYPFLLIVCIGVMLVSCGKQGGPAATIESVEVPEGDATVYLAVAAAEASSFDDTPDWAPLPDPMAPVDRDMLTRWSPKLGVDNEWIYFDFGKEKVLSKIVFKWERAYPTQYEIQVSSDAQTWKRLVLNEDGKGGVEEVAFPAIKTRYVKVIGLKRKNAEWGFSMWEFEPYGPQSLNPDEEVVDVDEVALKKERDELEQALDAARSPLTPASLDEMQKGICYTSWMFDELIGAASDKTMLHLKGLGVNYIAIVVPTYQDEVESDSIFTNDFEAGDTPSDEALAHAIETAHALGMKVLLKPHVDCRDGCARVDIPGSAAWFDSYEKMILRYAAFAERHKVEIFSVGTELEGTTFSMWEARWRDIITKIQGVYSGYLTYSANWTEYEEVPFWDMMDFVGIDAYFPISAQYDPPLEELVEAWTKIGTEIGAWLTEQGLDKNVVFTEIGYPSSDGAAKQPWSQITTTEDQDEQRDCLDAVFTAMTKFPYFKGAYVWQYLPQDRWSPLGFTIKAKKAEKVLSDWYKTME